MTIPTQQTVFRLTSRTGPSGLQEFREAVPSAGAGEVVVEVRGVGLNYRDVAIATDQYPLPVKDDVVPCADVAGVVVEVGERARGVAVGDRVISAVNPAHLYGPYDENCADATLGGLTDGVLREFIALPAHAVIKIQESSRSFAEWAALPVTAVTAWNAFYGNTPLKPGSTVVLQGTGGVSLTALAIARATGATTIITSSSDTKLAAAREQYGADHGINYVRTPAWGEEVLRLTGGRGADHVIDVGGAGTIAQSLRCVAYGGTVSSIGFLSSVNKDGGKNGGSGMEIEDLIIQTMTKGVVLRGVMSGSKQLLEEAVRFVAARPTLRVPLDRTFAFTRDAVVEALEYVAAGKQMGKVCIVRE